MRSKGALRLKTKSTNNVTMPIEKLSQIGAIIVGLHFLFVTQIFAVSQLATESRSGPINVRTFVHYVNWYNGNNWNTTTFPANGLGEYDSWDPHVIAFHKSTFLKFDKTPLISWWGRDDRRGDAFLETFFSIPPVEHDGDVRVALLYEARGIFLKEGEEVIDFNSHEQRAQFVSDMIHLDRKYFSNLEFRDRFFRIEEKPVVFVWYSHAFSGPFQDAVGEARKYVDFYLIGSNFTLKGNFLDEWKEFIPAFDAISAYGAYDQDYLREFGGPNNKYITQYFTGAALWSRWLEENAPNTDLMLPMSFAFDNSRSENSTLSFYMNAYEASLFSQKVKLSIQCSMADNPIFKKVIPAIIFASFNEHFEGTAMERSTHYEDKTRPYYVYGDIYRDVFVDPIKRYSYVDPMVCESLLY